MTHDDDDTKMLLLRLLLIDDDQDFSFFVWSHLRAQASTKAGLTNYKKQRKNHEHSKLFDNIIPEFD